LRRREEQERAKRRIGPLSKGAITVGCASGLLLLNKTLLFNLRLQ
jgi:hypothetical protein